MKTKTFLIPLLIMSLFSFSSAYSSNSHDSVSLKNGSLIKGRVVHLSLEEKVEVETSDGSLFIFSMPEIEKISVTVDSVLLKNGSLLINRLIEIIPGKSISSTSTDGSSIVFDISEVLKIVLKNYDKPKSEIRESKPEVRLESQSISVPQNRLSFLLFIGGIFGNQMIDNVIEDSELKSGIGFHGGAILQYKNIWFSATYLKSSHTYGIGEEKVTMHFSDILFGVGFDFLRTNSITSYVQGAIAFSNLNDKESDGFQSGKAVCLGAGVKIPVANRFFIGLSVLYGLNKYSEFEVEDANWRNEDDVKGNYLLLLCNLGFKLY